MTQPDPRVEALFQKIAQENIQVHPLLWTAIYQHIGDPVIVINLLMHYYLENNLPIPKEEAKTILKYTKRIEETIKKIASAKDIPEDEPDPLFREIYKKNLRLDPLTYELIVDRVRNDIMVIDLKVSRYLYPFNEEDKKEFISKEDAQVVLRYTHSTLGFLDRLRQATAKKEAF
ncbi:MAG: hypothetical protein NC928_00235 [Candidatus Omnitrophica bacterium]|nr:hypothetical protein [Candidatus Omnitrophota bacterium]